jgi:hypothetical protein
VVVGKFPGELELELELALEREQGRELVVSGEIFDFSNPI